MASTSPNEEELLLPPPREDWRLVAVVVVEAEAAAALALLFVGVRTPRAELRLRLVNRLMVAEERWVVSTTADDEYGKNQAECFDNKASAILFWCANNPQSNRSLPQNNIFVEPRDESSSAGRHEKNSIDEQDPTAR